MIQYMLLSSPKWFLLKVVTFFVMLFPLSMIKYGIKCHLWAHQFN